MSANTEKWELIGKVLHHEANQQEEQALQKWREELPQNEKLFIEAERVWEQTGSFLNLEEFNSQYAWKNVSNHISPSKKRFLSWSKIAAAASILVAAMGLWLWSTQNNPLQTQIASNQKQTKEVKLPDGTLVSLNVDSKIVFPEKFNGNTREVNLIGEAFFNVMHNAQKPFIIHTKTSRIKVLGTSFNVNAYPEKDTIEVIVSTGKVELSDKNTHPIILTKGEKGTLSLSKSEIRKQTNTNRNYAAWMNRTLVFRNSSLKDVVETLRKVYHVSISFNDDLLKNKQWTVTFHDQQLATVFNIMERTFDIKVVYENDTYILTHR